MQFYEFKETQERVILIGVQTEVGDDVEASLDELEELAETAGAETVAKVIQNREAVHPGTYIGKGKIEEVASASALDANGVICDDELSPAHLNVRTGTGLPLCSGSPSLLSLLRQSRQALQVHPEKLLHRLPLLSEHQ